MLNQPLRDKYVAIGKSEMLDVGIWPSGRALKVNTLEYSSFALWLS